MLRRFTSCLLIAVLLACPQLCRAGAGCCVAEAVTAQQACCEHCLPAHRSHGDADGSTPEKSPETCSNSCLCKGALVSHALEVSAPEAQPYMEAWDAHDVSVASPPRAFLRVNADFLRLCGAGLRIALCSLVR